jgi:hypothetical protein
MTGVSQPRMGESPLTKINNRVPELRLTPPVKCSLSRRVIL